jgi:hypothetical protein
LRPLRQVTTGERTTKTATASGSRGDEKKREEREREGRKWENLIENWLSVLGYLRALYIHRGITIKGNVILEHSI